MNKQTAAPESTTPAPAVTYTKLLKKYCSNVYHGNYFCVESAKAACSTDGDCYGVYDRRCDGAGEIVLCNNNGQQIRDSHTSCIYVKG